jgi:hypothetical protein
MRLWDALPEARGHSATPGGARLAFPAFVPKLLRFDESRGHFVTQVMVVCDITHARRGRLAAAVKTRLRPAPSATTRRRRVRGAYARLVGMQFAHRQAGLGIR